MLGVIATKHNQHGDRRLACVPTYLLPRAYSSTEFRDRPKGILNLVQTSNATDSGDTCSVRSGHSNKVNVKAFFSNALRRQHVQAFLVVSMWEVSRLTETSSVLETVTCETPLSLGASRLCVSTLTDILWNTSLEQGCSWHSTEVFLSEDPLHPTRHLTSLSRAYFKSDVERNTQWDLYTGPWTRQASW